MEKVDTNSAVRALIKRHRLYFYEVAEAVGVSEFTFCRWFRKELTGEQKRRIEDAVAALTGDSNADND